MPLNERDAAYLWDMLQAAREIHAMMQRHDLTAFMEDPVRQRALERCLEILGEAARKVSAETRSSSPEIAWREVIGLRNILAHDYGQIDHEMLYHTATEDIPRLIANLLVLLPAV